MASKSVEKFATKSGKFNLALFFSAILLTACTSGPCRKPLRTYPKTSEADSATSSIKRPKNPLNAKIWVYKYDGSLQCQPGTGKSLKDMQAELKGIEIKAKERRRDGLMHIQACGAKTGIANVYQISAQDQGRAEELGFRLWEFN